MSGDWYCRNCGYLSAGRVTYSETCDECHIPVEWHDEGQMTYIDQLEADRARLEWMAEHSAYLGPVMGGGHYVHWWRTPEDETEEVCSHDNWRSAIDEAMSPCEEA